MSTEAAAVRLRPARLLACLEVRAGYSEWQVEVDGLKGRAVAYPDLCGPLTPGDEVLLNTTAVELALGTGGLHFVVARLADRFEEPAPFPGREAGHVLKLRYTPLQRRVLSAEEEASPHRDAVQAFEGLAGTPVLAAELLSQAGAAAIAGRAAAPGVRIVLVLLDSAALPLAFSRLIARLRADGVLAATVTAGQAFGGDYEAVNVYSALVVARAAAGAGLVLVSQGPGNVGTRTEFGFSGLAVAEALHAADALGGRPILVPRVSDADLRPRHRGLSHHTRTVLRVLRVPVEVPLPRECSLGESGRHRIVEAGDADLESLRPYAGLLTTMGRGQDEDPAFFRAAAAAGAFAARAATGR
jgi:hypothetical protein